MPLKVLIVDDSSTIRAVIKRALAMSGVAAGEVVEASNGVEGLAALAKGPVDLIFADLHMPEMGGVEMTRRILSNPATARIPVIVVTAEPNQKTIDELRGAGVRAHIAKPFTPEAFRNAVTAVLGTVHA